MESAFGIDHGYDEVSKAVPSFGSLGTKMAGGATKLGNKTRRAGAGNIRGAASAQKPGGAGIGGFMGRTQMRAGGALKQLGAGMAQRPGLTGGLTAGAGAVGAGAGISAGDKALRRRY